jgi:hypothetical protein
LSNWRELGVIAQGPAANTPQPIAGASEISHGGRGF